MQPRLDISFPLRSQHTFWFGKAYTPQAGEYLLNHARTGIVMALRAALPNGGRVGVVAYNCHTVANAIVESGCEPVFVDVTEDLHIDTTHLSSQKMDALVVTNLFGIHNDIDTIRAAQPNAILIVDNAHGYGLPVEGDFIVYSINQGKFPALGEGGVLKVNNEQYLDQIQQQYDALPKYSRVKEIKLCITMQLKAWMHIPCIYGLITIRMKAHRGATNCRESITMRKMANGVHRMYQQALPNIPHAIEQRKQNAQAIADKLLREGLVQDAWYGENAFMLIARCKDPKEVQTYFAKQGVETATHFAKTIEWAMQFGYTNGACPMAEQLTKELIMIPTYVRCTV
jgi:dTDP-4-amino-4,6-dideoxygalactose transaminase